MRCIIIHIRKKCELLILEETSGADDIKCKPHNKYFEKWKFGLIKQFEVQGSNINFSEYVSEKYFDKIIFSNKVVPILEHDEKQILRLGSVKLVDHFVKSQYISEKDASELLIGLKKLETSGDHNICYVGVKQIVIKKN